MIYTAVPGRAIPLGYVGENKIEAVVFDRSAWVDEYGPGTIELVHRRRQDTDPLPVLVDVSGGVVTWTITDADTAYRGAGECQLTYFGPDGQIKKSEIWQTLTMRSLTSSEEVPEPYEGWVEQVLASAVAAAQSEEDAEAFAAGTRGGETVESDDPAYHNNAKYYSEQAAEYAATFETDKTLAVADKAADAKTVGARFVSDEKVINHAHSYVNYDYDTPFHQVENPDAPQTEWKKRIGIDRVGMIVTLNRQTGMQYSGYLRINGDMNPVTDSLQTTSGGVATWTSGVALKTGHQYAAVATLLSGTCSYEDSTTHVPAVWIYAAGESTRLGTETRSEDERTVTRTFTAEEGKTYNLAIRFISGEYICSNACILVELIDLTESTEAQLDGRLTTVEQTVADLKEDIRETRYRLTSGSITSSGAITSDKTYIRTTSQEIYPIESGDVLVADEGYEIASAHIYTSYNMWSSKNVAALTVTDAHRVEIPEDYVGKYLGFALQKTGMVGEDISAYVEDAQDHVSVVHEKWLENSLQALDGRVTSLESGNVPDYYFADDYVQNKAAAINTIGFSIGKNAVRTVFITDYHLEDNTRRSPDLISYIMSYTGIKNVMFGGDAINHAKNYESMIGGYNLLCDFLRDFAPVAEKGNFCAITGNHEYNNADDGHPSVQIPQEAIYNILNEPTWYKQTSLWPLSGEETNAFYVDDDAAKMRVYGIDCGYGGNISLATAKAVTASFSTVPEGYGVLLFSHRGTTLIKDGDVILGSAVSSKYQPILDAAVAMNDGASATVTYPGEAPWTVDFTSCQRAFLGAICGHVHYDDFVFADGRFPLISTRADTGAKNRDSAAYRIAGTIAEQAFDVVQLDAASATIYMTRIGYGADRIFHVGAAAVTGTETLESKLSGTLTWTSSDETVATVASGVVTAVSSGSASITATDENGNIEVWPISAQPD